MRLWGCSGRGGAAKVRLGGAAKVRLGWGEGASEGREKTFDAVPEVSGWSAIGSGDRTAGGSGGGMGCASGGGRVRRCTAKRESVSVVAIRCEGARTNASWTK
eukprot:6210627-Pleurochrysis_carterae.AAC.1